MKQLLQVVVVFSICLSIGSRSVSAFQSNNVNEFQDRTAKLGLQLGSSAACWADLNNDGWPELCCGGTVWRNESGKKFTKLTEGLGEVVAADFDNDGFVDLFSWSTFQLFRNENGKRFDVVELPELPSSISLGACWGDFNGDGFADIYVGGYEDWDKGITYPDMMLLNNRGDSFSLKWTNDEFRARGVTANDFDQDGDLDVYVSNYRLQPNQLWINDGSGKFKNNAVQLNAVGTSEGFAGGHSIGAAWGDFDNDGMFDLFVGNFAHRDSRGNQPQSRFLRCVNSENGNLFEDRGPCGVFYQESYASPSAGDYDNDGNLDLFFTTVYGTASFSKKNNPVLFRNIGKFQFDDATTAAKLAELPPTYQAAWADFDLDGDLDLVTAGKLFQNEANQQNWIELKLSGNGKNVNRSAIGAIVKLSLPDRILTRHVEAGTGQGNQNDLALHFGLGHHSSPVKLTILWPGGASQVVEGVDVNRVLTVQQNSRIEK